MDRVGVRLPEFSATDPEIWFLMMENNFQAAGIVADSTKYAYVMSAIRPRHIDPPTEHKYAFLKAEVIRQLGPTREHKRRLFLSEEMGDRKPSHFLRRLRNLAGDMANEELLRTAWFSRLPTFLQLQLADRTDYHLDQLADAADRIMDIKQSTPPQVAETVKPPSESEVARHTELLAVLGDLKKSIEAMGAPRGGKSSAQRYIGSAARRCEPPCSAQRSTGNATAHR